MKILIVGAGIGGLTAALCLLRAGHDVTVLEQATELKDIGAGLQCGANALRVMDYLGLMDELRAVCVAPEKILFRDYRSGATLYKVELGKAYEGKYGAPYFHLHRADLHRVLMNAFDEVAAGECVFNATVSSFTESDVGVALSLDDGREFFGDCLIGADGIHSVVRHQLFGDTVPRFTGNVAWRGVVPVGRLPKGFMDKIASNFVGPSKHAVIYYLRQQQLVNLVAVVENHAWTDESWVAKAPWEELKADFDGWHSTVQTLIDAMNRDECYRWALYNHKPTKNWSSERVTLLGDAAHATLPFMASGAAMAIEDARVLARALEQADSLAQGLQLYQRNRLARTARIQNTSEKFGKLYHINNRLARNAAFAALRMVGGKKEGFLPEYDANSVPLR